MLCFGLGGGLLVLLGELRADPPHFVKRTLSGFIALGVLLIVPWGICFAFKYGWSPFFSMLAPPAGMRPSSWSYALWFVLKVVGVIVASRLLDRALAGRGKGVFLRLVLRTVLIWGLGLVPFPRVFESVWGEMVASAAPSSMVDGVIDLLGESGSNYGIFAAVMLGIGVLFALPGTYALYTDVGSPALGIIISLLFASVAARVFFMQVVYGIIEDG
jgi:hypothetical protein